jgi:hypothetical protein
MIVVEPKGKAQDVRDYLNGRLEERLEDIENSIRLIAVQVADIRKEIRPKAFPEGGIRSQVPEGLKRQTVDTSLPQWSNQYVEADDGTTPGTVLEQISDTLIRVRVERGAEVMSIARYRERFPGMTYIPNVSDEAQEGDQAAA